MATSIQLPTLIDNVIASPPSIASCPDSDRDTLLDPISSPNIDIKRKLPSLEPVAEISPRQIFDPTIHLAYEAPKKITTFEDLGLPNKGICETGVTEPFRLFSDAAVREFRKEILSDKVLSDYTTSSFLASYQGREFPPHVAPFTHQAWKHPETLKAISAAAKFELTPIMEIEIGHVNYQLPPDGTAGIRNLSEEPSQPYPETDEEEGSGENVVGWHNDGYPFVCVLMLSNCATMKGGETGIETPKGMVKVRGPDMGMAVVMQGRSLRHIALRAFNAPERITMVTSFRAKDPMLKDGSILRTIRPISKPNRLNYHWCHYRFKLLSERFAIMASNLEEKKKALEDEGKYHGRGMGGDDARVVDIEEMREWLLEQIGYVVTTSGEMFAGY